MTTPLPDHETDSPLRQRYFASSRRSYTRHGLTPQQAAQAEAMDRFIYSRQAIGAWVGTACGVVGATLGLHGAGVSWGIAILLALAAAFGLLTFMVGGWLMPERFSAKLLWRFVLLMIVVTLAVKMVTLFATGALQGKSGGAWLEAALAALLDAAPFQLLAGLVMLLLVWVSSLARREALKHELAQVRAEQERDAAAAQLTQARLSLLQAQIHPHFLFNTLAALQHWVDGGDPRAAPLLRALTALLRGSTEMMLRDRVTLTQECELVRHYLAIMQSRLGERLRFAIDVAPGCESQPLPPGLLLTLVENAVQHGIAPQLRGGEVQVLAGRDAGGGFELRVLDDGAGLAADAPDGVGLANCRERLRHQFGTAAGLWVGARADGAGTEARLRIQPGSGRTQTG